MLFCFTPVSVPCFEFSELGLLASQDESTLLRRTARDPEMLLARLTTFTHMLFRSSRQFNSSATYCFRVLILVGQYGVQEYSIVGVPFFTPLRKTRIRKKEIRSSPRKRTKKCRTISRTDQHTQGCHIYQRHNTTSLTHCLPYAYLCHDSY